MRLIWSIACERAPLNRDRKAANLGEHVKRNKETHEPRTDRSLSLHRFFQPVSGCMNVVSVKVIEDFEVLFIAFADLRCQDRTVQNPLGSDDRWPRFVAHCRHSFRPTMSVSFVRRSSNERGLSLKLLHWCRSSLVAR